MISVGCCFRHEPGLRGASPAVVRLSVLYSLTVGGLVLMSVEHWNAERGSVYSKQTELVVFALFGPFFPNSLAHSGLTELNYSHRAFGATGLLIATSTDTSDPIWLRSVGVRSSNRSAMAIPSSTASGGSSTRTLLYGLVERRAAKRPTVGSRLRPTPRRWTCHQSRIIRRTQSAFRQSRRLLAPFPVRPRSLQSECRSAPHGWRTSRLRSPARRVRHPRSPRCPRPALRG